MSEVASGHLAPVPRTPQHVPSEENEEKSTTSTVRRPRNREVTSRYKSSNTQVALSRRYQNASAGDRLPNASDLPSPRWSHSSEKRHQSPSQSMETKVSNSFGDGPLKSSSDMCIPPRRPNARTELLWPPSTRTLSTSMQCEAYSQPLNVVHKKIACGGKDNSSVADQALRPTPNTAQRRLPEPKSTPSQFQDSDQAENAQPLDNIFKSDLNRWPGSNNKMYGAALSKSVDLSSDRGRLLNKATTLLAQAKPIYGSSRAPRPLSSSRALSYSINEGQESQKSRAESRGRRDILGGATGNKSSSRESIEKQAIPNLNELQASAKEKEVTLNLTSFDIPSASDTMSDTESSVCTMVDSLCEGITVNTTEVRTVRGTTVPARFWQDAANRSVRASQKSNVRSSMLESDLALASSRRPAIKPIPPMSPEAHLECSLAFNEAPSPPWTTVVGRQQPASLSRTSSYMRTTPSPGRSRAPLPSLTAQGQRPNSAAVMLNFGADTLKRGKKGLSQIDDAQLHRVLHNRLLQWRFMNAKTKAVMDAQSLAAQKSLYNACAKTFELRASTTVKRIQLGQGKQADKLMGLVAAQAPALRAWSDLQQEHSLALRGTIQALQSAVVRVPVTGGVKADTLEVKAALDSMLEVMSSVENSVNYLAPKAEETYLLMSELARVVFQERNLLEECTDLVAMASALEMEECSLRAHIVQIERERASSVAAQGLTAMLTDSC